MKLYILFLAFVALSFSQFTPPKKAGKDIDECLCRLDSRVNATSLKTFNNGTYYKQIQKFLWAQACGRSRGIFVLADEEYKGHTYSCANWPEEWGIKTVADWFKNPSDYEQHIKYLDMYLGGNYNATANKVPDTCDFAGFTTLDCGKDRLNPWQRTPWVKKIGNMPFRGVNVGGVFVLEPWITPKFTEWSLEVGDQYVYSQKNPAGSPGYQALVDHWENWYTTDDFKQMKAIGLNSIRLPVGWWYWAVDAGIDGGPYTVPKQLITDADHPITKFISMANASGIVIILDLHGAPGSQNGLDNSGRRSTDSNPDHWGQHWFYDQSKQADTVKVLLSMTKYIKNLKTDNVIALELLNEPWVFGDMSIVRDFYRTAIEQIRTVSDIPIFIHDAFRHSEWEWLLADWPYENIFMDTHLYHAFNSDDIASSNEKCDRNKVIVAENIACGYGSLLRYKTGTSLPTIVGEWSLAVDDCMGNLRGAQKSVQFKDYGQCKNLASRVGNDFWTKAYQQMALRQMSMAERELGWFFWTWKTGPGAKTDPSNSYWSFSDAVKAKIIPSPLPDTDIKQACYEFVSTSPYTC